MIDLEEPFVSVIVLNYNGLKHLKECFDSLNNLKYERKELILIDNNSQDNSVDFLRNNYPDVRIIQLNDNFGFAKANNIAASKANGEYLVFLNNDTYVDTNWLTELVKSAISSEKIGMVASKIYYYFDKELINYAGSSCDKYGKTHHIGLNQRNHKFFNVERETFFVCGAAFLITRQLYNIIGLFDPLYFIYSEDLDLSWRAWIFGYKVIYAPKSIVYHKIGQVMSMFSKRQKYLGERNLLRTLLKNYELSSLFKVLPGYIGKRIGIVLRSLTKSNDSALFYLYTYIKAFFWNVINIKSLIKNRKAIQRNRKRDDKFLFDFMNQTVKIEASSRVI